MRFFYPALVVSFAALVSGIAIDTSKLTIADLEDVTEVILEEQCRGAMKWSDEGFFRSGSTVRYHGHLWQCTHWNRGENPETSDIWHDLGECDPDAQGFSTQHTLGKRSTSNLQALDDDDEDTTCAGVVEWDRDATYRSGTTVHHDNHLWQTSGWTKEDEPSESQKWTIVATCPGGSSKVKRDECLGLRVFDSDALYRSGTTVAHGGKVYQAQKWSKGKDISDELYWKFVESC